MGGCQYSFFQVRRMHNPSWCRLIGKRKLNDLGF